MVRNYLSYRFGMISQTQGYRFLKDIVWVQNMHSNFCLKNTCFTRHWLTGCRTKRSKSWRPAIKATF